MMDPEISERKPQIRYSQNSRLRHPKIRTLKNKYRGDYKTNHFSGLIKVKSGKIFVIGLIATHDSGLIATHDSGNIATHVSGLITTTCKPWNWENIKRVMPIVEIFLIWRFLILDFPHPRLKFRNSGKHLFSSLSDLIFKKCKIIQTKSSINVSCFISQIWSLVHILAKLILD